MEQLIKKINEIMGRENSSSQLTIKYFCDGTMSFGIYEHEIPIIVDFESEIAYLNTETSNVKLTYDMLNELTQIIKVIEENIPAIAKSNAR